MIVVRKASQADVPVVVDFVRKKAAFDRELGCFNGVLGTDNSLISKALFGDPVFAYAALAFAENKPVGFALYYFRFSSFDARPSLWLDDLYVEKERRREGAGIVLMNALATEAITHNCTHLAWNADSRNPSGMSFYSKIGASVDSQQEQRMTFSANPESLLARCAEITAPK